MLAAYALVNEEKPRDVQAVHLTRLLSDGSDRERGNDAKITIGRPMGRPIVLAPVNDLLGLAVTEGIEDAFSVHEATGLGAWAAGCAGFMPALVDAVPNYIECVTIYAHPDRAGQDGARKLAEGLARRGIEIRVEGLAA
jgi:hypothetical protein